MKLVAKVSTAISDWNYGYILQKLREENIEEARSEEKDIMFSSEKIAYYVQNHTERSTPYRENLSLILVLGVYNEHSFLHIKLITFGHN